MPGDLSVRPGHGRSASDVRR